MEDTTSKAIPLKRARGIPPRVVVEWPSRWVEPVRGVVHVVMVAPRQGWLAALGAGALAIRGARSAWDRLVAEGAAVEGSFRARPARPPELAGPG